MNREQAAAITLKIPLRQLHSQVEEEEMLRRLAAHKMRIKPREIYRFRLRKKSLDARDKNNLLFLYQVEINGGAEEPLRWPQVKAVSIAPMVVGLGPAGLFAALALAEAGLRPTVIEKGQPVSERLATVQRFWQTGCLDYHSNIQFGQGGAGAFSDGKLTSRSKDVLARQVFTLLQQYGADPAIDYWYRPHIGSDRLPAIIDAICRRIVDLGGRLLYQTCLTDMEIVHGRLRSVTLEQDGVQWQTAVENLILATGNGARDIYRMAHRHRLAMEAKPFAIGLRLEHSQEKIDYARYGAFVGHPLLSAADYQLTFRNPADGRGVYTFCMCPGGFVVNASSAEAALVTNGASQAARDSGRANSAVVAAVSPGRDFGAGPLAGMEWQILLEEQAYQLSGSYALPSQSVEEFLAGQPARKSLYGFSPCSCGVVNADLRRLLPDALANAIADAICYWQRQIPGFHQQGFLAAIETRTSAPVRLLRGENRQSLSVEGLYPAGEGAGYAGGIVSSAIDGLKSAYALMERIGTL